MIINENMPIEEFEEKVDTLTDEQLDALIEGDEVEIKETPEAKTDEPIKDEPEVEAEMNQDEPNQEEPEKDEPKGKILIDDEYISKADEKDRKILESIKGEEMSDKLLKKHVSAEHFAARMKGEKGEVVSKLESLKKDFESQKEETTPVTPEKLAQIDEIVLSRLKAKYPDFPETEEEMNDLGYESQQKALEYMLAQREEKKLVQDQVKQVEYYHNNAPEINAEILNNDISLIKARMGKLGITEKDLGISFEFDQKGDFKDKRLDSLLIEKGKFDEDLIDVKTYGIPIFKERAFARKFRDVFEDDFYKAVQNKALVEGAKGSKETDSVIKTMSNQKPGTQTQFDNDLAKIAKMSPEEIDKAIDSFF